MNIEVRHIEEKRVLFIRHVGPYNSPAIYAMWGRLLRWAAEQGLEASEISHIGVCHDDPNTTAPEKCRYDACISVPAEVNGEGEIGVSSITSGLYAMVLHEGPYEDMSPVFDRICAEWIPAHGYTLRGAPLFEIYLNLPGKVAPSELRTEVYIPIENA